MANTYFQFKQFTIHQDKTAMKVGTDGVLIGAWANVSKASRILDIGTGTGLIALLLAQKTQATIHAIEIEQSAFEQACQNVSKSPWNSQIQVVLGSFQNFVQANQTQFDLIITNPPYFSNSLKANSTQRTSARHNDNSLPISDLLFGIEKLLSKDGAFYIILPYTEGLHFIGQARKYHLFPAHILEVHTRALQVPKRILIRFESTLQAAVKESLIIHNPDSSYTDNYIQLTKDYYYNF